MKDALELVDQIIEGAEIQDLEFKKQNIKVKGSLTIGQSWIVFHLKALRELLKRKHDQS